MIDWQATWPIGQSLLAATQAAVLIALTLLYRAQRRQHRASTAKLDRLLMALDEPPPAPAEAGARNRAADDALR